MKFQVGPALASGCISEDLIFLGGLRIPSRGSSGTPPLPNERHKNPLRFLGRVAFIPIYPNTLPTVPKLPRANRLASLVFSDLPASQGAITRLLNRCSGKASATLRR